MVEQIPPTRAMIRMTWAQQVRGTLQALIHPFRLLACTTPPTSPLTVTITKQDRGHQGRSVPLQRLPHRDPRFGG